MSDLDVPDGFGLACRHCGHVFPEAVTVGVAAAHFEIEHDTTDVAFELVVLCFRCKTAMRLDHSAPARAGGQRHTYSCDPCHRTLVVKQGPNP
jgi:transposase-like protein